MSFGLSKLKKQVETKQERRYVRHLVVGEQKEALLLYKKLVEKHGENEVGFLGRVSTQLDDYRRRGPSGFRGLDNLKALRHFFPDAELELESTPALFLKEGSWREFGGRSKSEKLLWNEEFYTEPRILGAEKLIPSLEQQDLEALSQKAYQVLLKGLEAKRPEDIVEDVHWSVEGIDGLFYECSNLYWAHSPAYFLELYRDKNKLSDRFIEICEATQTPAQLLVSFEFERPLSDLKETLFIPQSYTHEWGHFVGEFVQKAEQTKQWAEFSCFIDKDETSEEEISKKLRLLRKNLEKIEPDFPHIKAQEYIVLRDESPCLNIDDKAFLELKNEREKCFFVGPHAPLEAFGLGGENCEDSFLKTSNETRALMSLSKGQNE